MSAERTEILAPEAETHPLDEQPADELAKEIGPESDSDLHGDPDDPEPAPSAAEAASITAWRVAKSLLALRDQINRLAPSRERGSDGTIGDARHRSRASDHNPWVRDGGGGVVTAMDITHSPGHGCDAGVIATALSGNRDPRIKYIIWNRRIANSKAVGGKSAWEWRAYTGRNPHDKHIHISVKADPASYDSVAAWFLPGDLA
jgi:hypothetical protein